MTIEKSGPLGVLDRDSTPQHDGQTPESPQSNSESTAPDGEAPMATPPAGETPQYYASLFPGERRPIPPGLVRLVRALESELAMPVWLLIQPGSHQTQWHDFCELGPKTYRSHLAALPEIPEREVAIIIDSPGGYADNSYRLARLFQRRCGSYVAIVPRLAKSAATLFALGATKVILGNFGELGPLDAQLFDPDREQGSSALDEVHAIDRLHTRALRNVDETMWAMVGRTKKKIETLLPMVFGFEAQFMRPLLENIDAVHYTRMSRILKVAQEYASRLLVPQYTKKEADAIAVKLVEEYPEHGFVIDREETQRIGLRIESPQDRLSAVLDALSVALGDNDVPWFGRIKKLPKPEEET